MKRKTPDFQFKQFRIKQEKSGMKVGTDGVILGTTFQGNSRIEKILDVGTGTGLIALMAAQRFPAAEIMALEPYLPSYEEAKNNVLNSVFKKQIRVFNEDFQTFKSPIKFDIILSNPPFFKGKFEPESARDYARNMDRFPIKPFVEFACENLDLNGSVELILPMDVFESYDSAFREKGFYLFKKLLVKPTPEKDPHRVAAGWCLEKRELIQNELIIEEKRHLYTVDFKLLINDFYL